MTTAIAIQTPHPHLGGGGRSRQINQCETEERSIKDLPDPNEREFVVAPIIGFRNTGALMIPDLLSDIKLRAIAQILQ